MVVEEATFDKRNLYIDEEPQTLLGKNILFDVERDAIGKANRATTIWIGQRPNPVEVKFLQFLNECLDSPKDIDKTGSNVLIKDGDTNVPPCIKSVINEVFRDEIKMKYLINIDELEALLKKLDVQDRYDIMFAIEKDVRANLSKILASSSKSI